MDTVQWTDSHYCAFAEHRAAQVISAVVSRQSFALTPPPPRSPHLSPQTLPYKVEWKHKEVMQGDWMSSPRRQNSCSDPRGPVKRRRADVIRLSYLLFHCSHPALCLLIRLSQTSQWHIDFPAPLLQLPQSTCQTDGRFLLHFFCRVAAGSALHNITRKNIIKILFFCCCHGRQSWVWSRFQILLQYLVVCRWFAPE